MINTTFLATVKPFLGSNENPAKPDKRDLMPVILNPVAGNCPNKRIIAGTVAQRDGMLVNKTYLFTCVERPATEEEIEQGYGRQFNFSVVMEASMIEVMQGVQMLGHPTLIDVTEPAETPAPKATVINEDTGGDE